MNVPAYTGRLKLVLLVLLYLVALGFAAVESLNAMSSAAQTTRSVR